MTASTDLPELFDDAATFRRGFVAGLEDMLDHEELGAFILVLANATFDHDIFPLLKERLKQRFDAISADVGSQLRAGLTPAHAPDDLLVMLKLMAVGFEGLQLTRFRSLDAFELQFNQVRALRPARMAQAAVARLSEPFSDDGFHFNKPFLRKEVLWEGELAGNDCRLLYNKFPFAPLHGVLVIEPDACRPQYLSRPHLRAAVDILQQLGSRIAAIGLGYNSYGAYASVNHQHWQPFVRDELYPVELPRWKHNGGSSDYPVPCMRFDDVDDAWTHISALHDKAVPYNLLLRPGAIHVLARAMQGRYQHAKWTSGFAWSELAGSITTFSRVDFDGLDAGLLTKEYEKLHPPAWWS